MPLLLYGYFTIWSNTLVGLICTSVALGRPGLFTRPGTLGAAVVYITVVGVIYNVLLKATNPQTGVGLVIDTVFHSIVPLAYVLWWLALVPRGHMPRAALWGALGFPLAYTFVALVARGADRQICLFLSGCGQVRHRAGIAEPRRAGDLLRRAHGAGHRLRSLAGAQPSAGEDLMHPHIHAAATPDKPAIIMAGTGQTHDLCASLRRGRTRSRTCCASTA